VPEQLGRIASESKGYEKRTSEICAQLGLGGEICFSYPQSDEGQTGKAAGKKGSFEKGASSPDVEREKKSSGKEKGQGVGRKDLKKKHIKKGGSREQGKGSINAPPFCSQGRQQKVRKNTDKAEKEGKA